MGALLAAIVLAGIWFRIKAYDQSLIGDELSSLWIATGNGFTGVLGTVASDAEITPPLYFVAAWLTTKLGSDPNLVKLPSLLAGLATLPMVWLRSRKVCADRNVAWVATAIVSRTPIIAHFS